MMSDVCKHYSAAPRAIACPTGALIINEFSNVFVQNDICNGCGSCVAVCPFEVIARSPIDGHAHKCTLCYDRQGDDMTQRAPRRARPDRFCSDPIDVLEACDQSARGPQVYHAMAPDRLRAIGHSMGAATLLAIASSDGDLSAAHILRFILMWLLVLYALAVRRILGRVDMAGHLSDLGSHATALRVALHYTVFIVAGLGLPIVLCALSKGAPAVDAAIVLIVLAGALVPTLPGDAAAPRERGPDLKQLFS